MARQRTFQERERESRLTRGSRLAKGAWRLTRRDPALIGLALIGGAVVGLAAILEVRVRWELGGIDATPLDAPLSLLFTYATAFLAIHFALAMAAAADAGYDGNPMSMSEALAEASDRRPLVALWALVSAIFGVSALALADAIGGQFSITLFTVPWAYATAFVIPLLAIEAESPGQALRRSARLAGRRWLEELGGFLTFGFFLLGFALLGGIFFAVAVAPAGRTGASIVFLALLIASFLIAALLVVAAVQAFAVALLRHASEGGLGVASMDNLEDPPAPNRPGGGWIAGRGALALVAMAFLVPLAATIAPHVDRHQREAEHGHFQMHYPVSYGVELESGAPVVYGERVVGVVRGTELDGADVNVRFDAEPSLWPLIVDHRINFDQYEGHYFLRVGPVPSPGSSGPT